IDDIAHVSTAVCHKLRRSTLIYSPAAAHGGRRLHETLFLMSNHRVVAWKGLTALGLLAAVVFLVSLLVGSSGISAERMAAALLGGGDEAARSVMAAVRLPRTLAAFGVGSLLALAGVLLQALFRNPLADSYVLGVSGGAAIGALLAIAAGAEAVFVHSAAI